MATDDTWMATETMATAMKETDDTKMATEITATETTMATQTKESGTGSTWWTDTSRSL